MTFHKNSYELGMLKEYLHCEAFKGCMAYFCQKSNFIFTQKYEFREFAIIFIIILNFKYLNSCIFEKIQNNMQK